MPGYTPESEVTLKSVSDQTGWKLYNACMMNFTNHLTGNGETGPWSSPQTCWDKEFTSGDIAQGTFQGGEHICLFIISSKTFQRSENYRTLSCLRPSKGEAADYYSLELIQWRFLQSPTPQRDSDQIPGGLEHYSPVNEAWRKRHLPQTNLGLLWSTLKKFQRILKCHYGTYIQRALATVDVVHASTIRKRLHKFDLQKREHLQKDQDFWNNVLWTD